MKHTNSDIKIFASQKAKEIYDVNKNMLSKMDEEKAIEECCEIFDNSLQYTGFSTDYYISMTDKQSNLFWSTFTETIEKIHNC